MSVSACCDAVASIADETPMTTVQAIAAQCEAFLGNTGDIIEAVENALSISSGKQRLLLWVFVDRLVKQHDMFLDALRPRILSLATQYAPATDSAEWSDFAALLKASFANTKLFGPALVNLIFTQLTGSSTGGRGRNKKAATGSPQAAARRGGAGNQHGNNNNNNNKSSLVLHSTALRSVGGAFVTKAVAVERSESQKHRLQVKTLDSQMAMNVASSYAPARPVELAVPQLHPDADAPRGHMKALPSDYNKSYEEERRRKLREVMAADREEQKGRQDDAALKKIRSEGGKQPSHGAGDPSASANGTVSSWYQQQFPDYSDVQMPLELPRDEYGVRRGNFPLGVRFIREAIRSCGGAIELDVIVNRISTLSNRDAVAEFGNVREFLQIHSPTFRICLEGSKMVVRLVDQSGNDEPTWEVLECPSCSKRVRGRNFARHHNSRRCITAQLALGLQQDYEGRGPIAELAFATKLILQKRTAFTDELDYFSSCLEKAAAVRRFRLASPRQFAPVLKAMRTVRDWWLGKKGVTEMSDAVVDCTDASVVHFFAVIGENVHRLPIAWIETGDVIDMCQRFSSHVNPPYNPPPRPADPRISLQNEYAGFLFCESEVDDDDEPSGDEDEFSDDEAPTFTFAPPVGVAETLFTAGFERDTKQLQHRMRTAPPMVLTHVLKSDGHQSYQQMYDEMGAHGGSNFSSAAPAATKI